MRYITHQIAELVNRAVHTLRLPLDTRLIVLLNHDNDDNVHNDNGARRAVHTLRLPLDIRLIVLLNHDNDGKNNDDNDNGCW